MLELLLDMAPPSHHRVSPHQKAAAEIVDPRWLLKAGAAVLAAALLCAYATLCFLFWQGQWQLVLHPSSMVKQTPSALNLNFEAVRFGVDATGTPQLSGWWIPSDSSTDPVALLLHGGDGNMGDALTSAQGLHDARLNVLLFDYRGFGASGGPHPTQTRMEADAASALEYLTRTRGLASSAIVLCGEAAGASLALHLAAEHSDIPAVILLSPDGDFTSRVKQDSRSRLVPVSLLFHEDFPLTTPLHSLPVPKLIISTAEQTSRLDIRQIADPKMTIELPARADVAAQSAAGIRRFMDSYVPRPPARLQP